MDNADLNDYAVSKIESVLGRVPGVGEVEVFGTGYSMRVWLDPDKLTKYGMTTDDVVAAVRAYNVEVSAGQLGGAPAVPGQRLNASILVQSLLVTPEEFAAIPLRTNPDGSVVRCGTWAGRSSGPRFPTCSSSSTASRPAASRSGRRRERTPSTPPTGSRRR